MKTFSVLQHSAQQLCTYSELVRILIVQRSRESSRGKVRSIISMDNRECRQLLENCLIYNKIDVRYLEKSWVVVDF